jgi:hypothetical protein
VWFHKKPGISGTRDRVSADEGPDQCRKLVQSNCLQCVRTLLNFVRRNLTLNIFCYVIHLYYLVAVCLSSVIEGRY